MKKSNILWKYVWNFKRINKSKLCVFFVCFIEVDLLITYSLPPTDVCFQNYMWVCRRLNICGLSLNIYGLILNIYELREGFPKKSSCSFGFCLNYFNPPPFFWKTCTTYFEHQSVKKKIRQGSPPPSPSPN